MRLRLLIAITFLLIIGISTLKSQQVFSISELNGSEFPKVKAGFIALNASGQSYKNLTKNDFVVFDNGFNVSPSITVECLDTIVDPAVSVILILDKSTSMNYEDDEGQTRWSWVKEGATSFINTMNLNNGSKIGIISFAKLAGKTCPFTNNKKELLDSLDEINIGGGTEYDPPFLDTRFGAVKMFQDGSPDTKIRRIAIFLTDGEPNHNPSVDSIKTELTKANIQVYSITVSMPMNKDLADISSYTGGGAYAVYTKDELNAIYEYIALDIQKKQICSLYWDSPFGCTEASRYRSVSITFVPQNAQIDKYYEAPQNSIAYIELSEDFLEFGNPPANNFIERNLTLTARNSDFNLTQGTIQPSTFFQIVNWDVNGSGSNPPFTIEKDSSRTIRVRFTQGASVLYRQASMIFEGNPCPPTIQLIGGITQIRIISPNGGEIFSTCETVKITWAGVEADKPVNLSYSSNNGSSWNSIASNVTGLAYNWKPPAPGNRYLVRGTVSPDSYYLWAKGFGSPENDVGRSIAITHDDLFVYVTGGFEGTLDFGSKTISSRGAKDIFLAKFDSDGNLIWVESAGGPGYDSANAVCVDDAGNAYITGVCYQNARFGNITPNVQVAGLPYCFIARYAPGGGTPAVQLIGANTTYNTFEARGDRIRFRETEKEIDVRGTYLNSVQSPMGYSLPKVTVPTPFTATLRSDLSFGPVNRDGPVYPDYSSNSTVDSDGNRYSVGNFNNSITFGNYTLNSKGKTDIFLNKFGGTPGSEDTSDSTFTVESPKFEFSVNDILFEDTMLGIANDTIIDNQLCNIGTLPIEITGTSFSGSNPNDFRLTTNPVSRILLPGECIPLEIAFQPTDIGMRSAQLVISGLCTQDIFMNLSGNGVCGGEAPEEIDFGKVNLSFKKDSTVECIFKNTNPNTVVVKPNLTGPNASDFTLSQSSVFVEPDSCLRLKVSFIPSAPGPRNAVVEFQLPQGCVNPITELKGEGVETALTLNSVNWGDRRVLTSNDSFLVIRNSSTLPAKIDSLILNSGNNDISIVSPPATPYNIPANDSLVLQVNFTPQLEQIYSVDLQVYAQSNSTPLVSVLEGNGVIPKLAVTWICDTATIPGNSSMAQLLIENTSSTMDLTLFKAHFVYPDPDYQWAAGSEPADVIIPKNGQATFDVIFSPQKAGTISNLIEITHDAATGPEVNPVKDTTVDALCDGLGLTVVDTVDFEGVLICDSYTEKLRLRNTSWQAPIKVTSASITGPDADAFNIALTGEIEIPPGNSEYVDVTFSPAEVKLHTAKLSLQTSVGYDIDVTLIGIGEYLYYTAKESEYENEPGYPVRIPVSLRINKLAKGSISEAKMQIEYDNNMLRYDKTTFTDYTNWTWDDPILINPGLLEISGNGTIDAPFNNQVFEIQWTVFLADVRTSQIKLKPIMGNCLTKDTAITDITYSPFCFMDGRLVVTGNTNYYLAAPEPNPASDKTTIKFGVGLKGNTELVIYNLMGEMIDSYVNSELESGRYELDLSTSNLRSGTYIISLRSGHVTKTVKLVVNK